jgi:hypothetical protein
MLLWLPAFAIISAALSVSHAHSVWSTAQMNLPRYSLSATSASGSALFAGGYTGSVFSDVVDVYDVAMNTWTKANLSLARSAFAATSAGGVSMFAGGLVNHGNNNYSVTSIVDIFDHVTRVWTTAQLSLPRWHVATVSLGNLSFFGGGGHGVFYV